MPDWLTYLEAIHPKDIDMGLERVNRVNEQLNLTPKFPLIIVGGTNGKGSVCAMLEAILCSAGYRVGCYTSPHLLRYNERMRINKTAVDDASLCRVFERVEQAREACQTSLTFFEFGTLAAMDWFIQLEVEVAILEVGLGGRLDAVNVFSPACSIVTSIDLDHMEYLGDNREEIGCEKVAIFRRDTPAVCAEIDLPHAVLQKMNQINPQLLLINQAFGYVDKTNQWDYWGPKGERYSLPIPALRGKKQLQNACTSLAALDALYDVLPVAMKDIREGLSQATIPGRFQVISTQPMIILDVAHNPAAAMVLADNLASTKAIGKTYAVFAMLADKDIAGVVRQIKQQIDVWLISSVDSKRSATVEHIHNQLNEVGIVADKETVLPFLNVQEAFVFACREATKNDRICVFGSFYTVSDVLRHWKTL
ncbi:MAG TPA: bifunctional tetrahydrofolate synthase/dihydrofolate synthase [Nitrosomonas sp.]|nr:bifunctional tetrahydrofolate synthase/dihydrofolate synthase [Nitrosomonas sp.]HRB20143.1 bifunctional tetrahydrofolate synthase/dihydrofolate synthase [Nitrosomonas sp.]HRB31697.1 bifunctional tetrahydrofolate synthase/dihydrofolate synthase [Nitrosomonas sp.]HRB44463.1 bifunctional tetrahydrofolate synthase/dihydrofolate synthase [Nitrosomonas sp.]HRB76692.1 bifunctional tetrahydrofolate synthase/dihydrofolate synthase [Nitrosomonas sp.]